MRFVAIKETKQQDILALHRIRERLIKSRTALVNQLRGLLAENGIILNQQIQTVRREVMEVIENEELSELAHFLFKDQYEELLMLDKRISKLEIQLKALFDNDIQCKRLEKIPGIGIITASVLVAAVGNAKLFKNGRELAAWVGLVPRQASSGNKKILLGISKRGDRYLRTLLIHGARASLSKSKNKEDERSLWMNEVRARRGFNKACVALANKNVRTAWALLAKGEDYRQAA
jgi:transposase